MITLFYEITDKSPTAVGLQDTLGPSSQRKRGRASTVPLTLLKT